MSQNNQMSQNRITSADDEYAIIPEVKLSYAQYIAGATLNELQESVIRQTLVSIANEKLFCELDATNPTAALQLDGYRRGRIDGLKKLLDENLKIKLGTHSFLKYIIPRS